MPYDENNPFAKILRGELPATVVEDTEHTLTFMDIMPKAIGHALVIPKHPAPNLYDISNNVLAELIQQVRRVAKAAKVVFPNKGVRVIQLNDSTAGQSVFHIHFHVIPSDDGMNFGFHGTNKEAVEQLQQVANQYQQALANLD